MILQRREISHYIHTHLEVGLYRFKRVREFIYLGSILTQRNEESAETKARLQAGNKCYYGLIKLLKTIMLLKNLKVQIYCTLIRLVIMYGYETWTLLKSEKNKLLIFERKILRSIFGPYRDEETGE